MPLVTTTEMFRKAYEGGYAIGAFNVNNMEIVQGITEAAKEANSPVILQVSAGARKYAKHGYLMKLVEAAVEDTGLPIALHLDHGEDFDICKACIDGGFTSVMIDGSKHSFEDNIALTRKVVEYAHQHGVVVEGELGRLAGIGTSHGAFKFKPGTKPQLRFDILEEVGRRLPGFPIVLHGASSVIPKYVDIINANGGQLKDAIGVPEDQLRQAAKLAVCKINIDSDLRLAMTAGVRQQLIADPANFDPRSYLKVGRQYVKDLVKDKIVNVLGSDNKL